MVVIDATPPFKKYTVRTGSPLLCRICLTRIGTVLRNGHRRRKSSAVRAARSRFFGRPFDRAGPWAWGGGRTAADVPLTHRPLSQRTAVANVRRPFGSPSAAADQVAGVGKDGVAVLWVRTRPRRKGQPTNVQ
jgi:hypothetical protein